MRSRDYSHSGARSRVHGGVDAGLLPPPVHRDRAGDGGNRRRERRTLLSRIKHIDGTLLRTIALLGASALLTAVALLWAVWRLVLSPTAAAYYYRHHRALREGFSYTVRSDFGIHPMRGGGGGDWALDELQRRTRVFRYVHKMPPPALHAALAGDAQEVGEAGGALVSFLVPCEQCAAEKEGERGEGKEEEDRYRRVAWRIAEQVLTSMAGHPFEVVVMGVEGGDDGSTFRNDMLLCQHAASAPSSQQQHQRPRKHARVSSGRFLYFLPTCTADNVIQVEQMDLGPLLEVRHRQPSWLIMGGVTASWNGTVENAGVMYKRSISKINGMEGKWEEKRGPTTPHVHPTAFYHGMPISALLHLASSSSQRPLIPIDAAVVDHMIIPRQLFVSAGGFDMEHHETIDLASIDLCLRIVEKHRSRFTDTNRSIVLHTGLRVSIAADRQGLLSLKQENFVRRKERLHWHSTWNAHLWDKFVQPRIDPTLRDTNVMYVSPMCTPSGFADEGITTAMALEDRVNLLANDFVGSHVPDRVTNAAERPRSVLSMLNRLNNWNQAAWKDRTAFKFLIVSWTPAIISHLQEQMAQAHYRIGRYTFESDRFPDAWAPSLLKMDELWLTSVWSRNIFQSHLQKLAPANHALPKLFVVPEPVDINLFNPVTVAPLSDADSVFAGINRDKRFKFLSVFEWSVRKNWRGMLVAYFQEFSKEDNVVLYIKTQVPGDAKIEPQDHQKYLDSLIREVQMEASQSTNRPVEDMAQVIVHHRLLHLDLMPSLYRSVDAYVQASHGEGCGRPYMEAMAMELPVIGTGWGGNLAFMNNGNSYLIDYDLENISKDQLYSFYVGHKWANPRLSHLRELMRHVVTDREDAKRKAHNARKFIVENNRPEVIVRLMVDRLGSIRGRHQ